MLRRAQRRHSLGKLTLLAMLLMLLAPAGCDEAKKLESDPESPIAERTHRILKLEDRLESIAQLARLLQELPQTREAAHEALEGYDQGLVDRGDIELVLIVDWWASFDPDGALEWSEANWVAKHPRIIQAITRSIARQDPQRAVDEFVDKNRGVGAEFFVMHLQPVIVGWQESGKPGLFEFILSQPALELVQQGLGTYVRLQVLKLGPEQAKDWALETTERESADTRRWILQRVATSIAELDGPAAGAWVSELVEAGESDTMIPRVARRWSRTDPKAVIAWLEGMETSTRQQQAIAQAFATWLRREPEVAEAWLLDQGERIATSLSPATHTLLKFKADSALEDTAYPIDWETELDLAMRIEDPGERWGAATRLARTWALRDSDAAMAWADAHDMPEDYRYKVEAYLSSVKGSATESGGIREHRSKSDEGV